MTALGIAQARQADRSAREVSLRAGSSWHSLVGRFSATVVTLSVERAIVRTWLHSGLRLAGSESGTHPVYLFIGRQAGVSPALFDRPIRFPFHFRYPEIIVAVPDLSVECDGIPGGRWPVTYFPHLFLGSWGSTFLGRGIYGINKSFARIDDSNGQVHAANRRGRRLLDATISPLPDRAALSFLDAGRRNPGGFLRQPLVVGTRGRLRLASFQFENAKPEIVPVRVKLDLAEGFVSWMPATKRDVPGIDEDDLGAFHFESDWRLSFAAPQ